MHKHILRNMESEPTHKVQLVRCPKCRMLLPELPGILVYKCGGCDTVLQVKKRKNDADGTTSGSRETEAPQMKELNRVNEVGESSISSRAILHSSSNGSLDQNDGGDHKLSRDHVSEGGQSHSSDKCSLDQNGEGDQKIPRDHVSEVGESISSSQKVILSSSGESSLDQNWGGDQKISRDHIFEVGECSNSSQKAILCSSDECSLDQNEGGDKKLSREHVSEGGESGSSNQTEILPSSAECSFDQNRGGDQKISRAHVSEGGESSSFSQIAILPSSDECSLDQTSGGEKKSRDCSTENSEDVNPSDGDQNNESDHNETQVCDTKQPEVSNEFCSSSRNVNHEDEELSQFARANSEVELNEMSSPQSGAKLAVDINSESDSTVRSSTTRNMAKRENNSTVTSQKLAAKSFSSEIILSSLDEQPKQRQLNVNLSYERRDFFSPRSEFSSKTDYYKAISPRFRISYEYDGSVSSYDGTDDQVPDQHMNLHKNAFKVANSVTSEERSRRNEFLGNSIMNENSKMQRKDRNLSSASPDTRPCTTDYRKWGGDELLGSTGYGLPVSNGTRLQDDEFPYPLPFYQRGYPSGYESGSTSRPMQVEFHQSSSEHEKIKLLKMVYELQDRINKTCHVNEATRRVSAGVTGKEKYIPDQYSGEIPEDDFFHDLNYHRFPERWRHVSNWPHQNIVSPVPFSGESTDHRQHMNCFCVHCYPQDLQCSAPLPPRFLSHNKGFRRFHFHPAHSSYNSYSSCLSSPQNFADSEFPIWHCDTKSDYKGHEDHHMKETHHLVKKHLRPTAGGAPFITCYNCLNPLQLPADFLVFKRRFHLLRCGACSKVLKFSLKRTHIVPYIPKAAAPPSSQHDDYSDARNRRNSVSSSRGNGCSPANPVSCSDDYGVSHCKSCSTDGDPVILTPIQNGQGNTNGKNLSYDSSESTKERPQLVKKQPGNSYKNPLETQASPGTSSNKSRLEKLSSEIEELPAKTGSPLHLLMGYSSPSQVLRGSDDPSSSGTCSQYT